MKTITNLAAIAALGLLSFSSAAHAVQINTDTTVDYAINDDVYIGDGMHAPTVNLVAGSSVLYTLQVSGNSTVNISGGTVGSNIFFNDDSIANFFGTGFTSNLLARDDGFNLYTISGTLSDGTVLNGKQFVTSGNGSFAFKAPVAAATPEPGSVALLVGMGVTGAGVLRRRRKSLPSGQVLTPYGE